MAQHDYDVANGTGAAVRADINSALGAIATNNSGATAPSTTFAYQWWFDTTDAVLKMRNGTNTGWVTVAAFDATAGALIPVPSRDLSVTATGTVQGDAAELVNEWNIITGGAADTGVIWAGADGVEVVVRNESGSDKIIYPLSGGAIDGGATDEGVTLVDKSSIRFIVDGADLWT